MLLVATSFYDHGVGRFLISPGFGGAAALLGGLLAYIAAVKKVSADREAARKQQTHEQRWEAYFALDGLMDEAIVWVREVHKRAQKYQGKGEKPSLAVNPDKVDELFAAVAAVQQLAPMKVRRSVYNFWHRFQQVLQSTSRWANKYPDRIYITPRDLYVYHRVNVWQMVYADRMREDLGLEEPQPLPAVTSLRSLRGWLDRHWRATGLVIVVIPLVFPGAAHGIVHLAGDVPGYLASYWHYWRERAGV